MQVPGIESGYLVRLDRGEEVIASLAALTRDERIGCGAVTGLGAHRPANAQRLAARACTIARKTPNPRPSSPLPRAAGEMPPWATTSRW